MILPVTSPSPKYCTSTLPSLFKRRLLVLAIHRRAGIDDVAQGGMIVAVDGGVLDHHFQDRRHGENIGDAVSARSAGTPRRYRSARSTAGWSARRARPAPIDARPRHATAAPPPATRRASVVPGIRSQRWLVTTKAIWPWVSTAALERPVVPEVKKNQQGSSYSTAALSNPRAGMRRYRLAHRLPRRRRPRRSAR